MLTIKVERTKKPKEKPDQTKLGFGQYFSDHMFVMDYSADKGWIDPRIVPYGPLTLDPSSMVFHYAQELFEGLKAYRAKDGRILLFRPRDNAKRMNGSNERMCIPQIDEEMFLAAVRELVKVDADWIPQQPETSLYIRPFVIATDPYIGVRASNTYKFMIITSPVGAYYPEGLNPVKIMIEDEDVRAVRGGTGMTKCGGNYAATLRAQDRAHRMGFSQVLWLDGVERKYIEEVGAMNVFFMVDGTAVTPSLEGSILPGVTRRSCIELLGHWGVPVQERKLSLSELMEAARAGKLGEAFGSGTAAVISPVGLLRYKDEEITLSGGKIGPISQKLYDTLTGIQWGNLDDPFGWTMEVK